MQRLQFDVFVFVQALPTFKHLNLNSLSTLYKTHHNFTFISCIYNVHIVSLHREPWMLASTGFSINIDVMEATLR